MVGGGRAVVGPIGPLDPVAAPSIADAFIVIEYDGSTDDFTFVTPPGWTACGRTSNAQGASPRHAQVVCSIPQASSTHCSMPAVHVASGVVGASGSSICGSFVASCTTTYNPTAPYTSSCSDSVPIVQAPGPGTWECWAYVPYTTTKVKVTCSIYSQ